MKENLVVREETGSKESSEKEEDAYKEDERQAEPVRPPIPSRISLNRFGFHVDCAERYYVLLCWKCKMNGNLLARAEQL